VDDGTSLWKRKEKAGKNRLKEDLESHGSVMQRLVCAVSVHAAVLFGLQNLSCRPLKRTPSVMMARPSTDVLGYLCSALAGCGSRWGEPAGHLLDHSGWPPDSTVVQRRTLQVTHLFAAGQRTLWSPRTRSRSDETKIAQHPWLRSGHAVSAGNRAWLTRGVRFSGRHKGSIFRGAHLRLQSATPYAFFLERRFHSQVVRASSRR
jgi:hypothetical protein